MYKNKKQNSGFTLIEVIIYIALFAILMSGAVIATYQLLDGGNRNQKAIAIQEEGTYIYRKINWALSGATSAQAPDTKTLSIVRSDIGSLSPLVFKSSGDSMTLTEGTSAPVVLNNTSYKVSAVNFNVSILSATSTSITANFSIENIPFVFQTYLR